MWYTSKDFHPSMKGLCGTLYNWQGNSYIIASLTYNIIVEDFQIVI